MALGVAANTIGKVIASTVFMSCLVHVSISDFFTIRQKRIRRGVRCQGNRGSLKPSAAMNTPIVPVPHVAWR